MRGLPTTVRLAIRSFARDRTFSVVAVLSLGLAIALNTTMYSVIDAMVDPQVDMRAPDHLYWLRIWGNYKHRVDDATVAALLRTGSNLYEGTALYTAASRAPISIERGRHYRQATMTLVSPNAFTLLGVRPAAGRLFTDADFASGDAPVVISDGLAADLFDPAESPVGALIDVDGTKHPVIGVLGRTARFPGSSDDIWILPPPTVSLASLPSNIVRLRSDVTVQHAAAALSLLSDRLAGLARESPKDTRFQLIPATGTQFHAASFHYALIGAVVAILLIACANLANLQLARGIGRSRELALRAALGASRRVIVGQLLLESAVLAAGGLVLGLLLTFWGAHLLRSRIPPSIAEYVIAPQISWRVLLFAMVACAVCVVLIGLVPALRVSRVDPNVMLKAGAGTGANKQNRRQYGVMVAAEMGLALVLLSGAAIVLRTALRAREVHVGYDLRPLTSTWIFQRFAHDTTVSNATLVEQTLSVVRALPNVQDATVIRSRSVEHVAVTVIDAGGVSKEIPTMTDYTVVTPSYFRTMGLPIVHGRGFLDGIPSAPEVVVDQTTARTLWPSSDAVGALIKLGDFKSNRPWVRVVGVVGTANESPTPAGAQLAEKSSKVGAIYYLPDGRDSSVAGTRGLQYDIITRAKSDPDHMPIVIGRTFRQLLPTAYVSSAPMADRLGFTRARLSHDFIAATFVVFAALAVSLAALGIYGIVSHSVAERRRELGVRIALGASGRSVVGLILREGNVIALAGVAIGLYLTKDTVKWLHAFSTEGDEYDAVLFAALALVLFLVAVVAALLPALRAARIDPVESLRSE